LSPFGELFFPIIIRHCLEELREIKKIPIRSGDVVANECIYITGVGSLLPLKMHLRVAPRSAVCLTTGPYRLPRRVSHTVRSSAPSFDFQHPLFSIRSSGSCLHLLPRRPITSIFPSITCFRRQYLCNM